MHLIADPEQPVTRWSFAVPADGSVAPQPAPPSFSVIIAAYQAAGTIGRAVSSALGQTHPPAEIIVCDDGSSDDLEAALRPFAAAVRLIRIPHGGPARARNAAGRAARGDFLVVLDADDYWMPQRLEAMAELARLRPDVDLISTDSWFERGGRRVGRFYGERAFPRTAQRRAILEWCFIHPHAAVRRSRWEAVGGYVPEVVPAEDWDCWLRLILSGSVAGCVDAPLASYRIWDGSLSANRARSLGARARVLERALALPLSPEERRVAVGALSVARRRAADAAIAAAILGDDRGRRRVLAAGALRRDWPVSRRIRAAGAAALPSAARRRMRRRGVRGGDDRVVPGE